MEINYYKQLCSVETLQAAWLEVKTKNTSGGIDAVSVKEFELIAQQRLNEISAKLKAESYTPLPLQKISLQKKDGSKREIGLLSVSDKIVQRAVKNLLEPVFEKDFLNVSYAYRANKSTAKAIKRLLHYIRYEHYSWFAIADIDSCFDEIPTEKLLSFLELKVKDRKLTHLIRLWLQMGKVNYKYRWFDTKGGLPQGGILSPLLANFYLNWLDRFVTKKDNIAYLRYADDIIICAHSKRAVQQKLQMVSRYLEEKLKLKLNDKSQLVHIKKSFTFLGVEIRNGIAVLSEEKEQALIKSLNENFGILEKFPAKKFTETLNGIKSYYAQVLADKEVGKLDDMLINCLKNKLSEAFSKREITSKISIRNFIRSIRFFTSENELSKTQLADEIALFCTTIGVNNSSQEQKITKTVRARKREFQKMESAAMELVVSTPGVVLGKKQNSVVVKKKGETINEINVVNLRSITIASAGVGFSSNLIKFCADKNIAFNFLNFDGKPYALITTPKFAHARNELVQLNAQQSESGLDWIKAVLIGKMKNQANTLKFFSRQRKDSDPDFTKHLPKTLAGIKECQVRLKKIIAEKAVDVQTQIMTIEARASHLYWQQVGRILDDYISFEKREQKGAIDPVNSMLNYGYAILYSKIWHAVINVRMNPCIGILHSSENTNAAFVYDMVEEFRSAIVDRVVISLISKGEHIEMTDNLLSEETKHRLLERLLERFNSVEKFRKTERRVNEIIHYQVYCTRRFFMDEIPTYKPYIKTW
ncbi:CRISPR-associated endonuclease Cas1 [Marinifilum sp. D714]|uniref:CRISPR-associated endonuclease Cas1 n=1 Tax=Marinifilum sp. D714 TaxID=2937523 RepID=UPI0027CA321F|nr:CRISPR-associated endonuclease Cas1 [Marinifilum sp. D714]MDQ2178594.1 CRISPR-associated endonuclease Cas1 [Marinifilum sp. D714]